MKTCPCTANSNNKSDVVGIPLKATISQAGTKWDCPACMVQNKLEDLKCPCCGETNPKPPPPKVAATKWVCPVCMVDNKPDAPMCVCCTEKNPNASSVAVKDEKPATSSFSFGIKTPASSDEACV